MCHFSSSIEMIQFKKRERERRRNAISRKTALSLKKCVPRLQRGASRGLGTGNAVAPELSLGPVFSRTGAEATDCPSEDQPQRLGAGWGELPANHLQAHSLQAPGGRSGPAGRSARVRISSRQLGLNILSSKRFYEPPAAQGDPSGGRKPFLSEQMRLRVVPPPPRAALGP